MNTINAPDIEPVDPRVDAYLSGRLTPQQQERFELEMLGSPALQAQVRDAYTLGELLRRQPERWRVAEPVAAWQPRQRRLSLALAAGLGVLAVGAPVAWWGWQQQQQQQRLAGMVTELEQQLAQVGTMQLNVPTVRLGALRSLQPDDAPLLRQQPGVTWVRVVLDGEALGGEAIAAERLRLLAPDGRLLPLPLPTADTQPWRMEAGEYVLQLRLDRLEPGHWQLQVAREQAPPLRFPFEVRDAQSED